jgi:hypothetical protein
MPRKPTAPETLDASVNKWLDGVDDATKALRHRGVGRRFWLSWATHVLVSQGVDPSWRSMTIGELLGAETGASAIAGGMSEAHARVAAFRDAAVPRSPDWYAATLWLEEMGTCGTSGRYDLGYDPAERPARVIGQMLEQIKSERLGPDAAAGRKARANLRRGGASAAKKRERNLGRSGWRKKALRLDSMMDNDSRKERAVIIAGRLRKVGWRTVYDALPPRRSRKSSR